jgi:heme exporter protein C
MNQLWRWILWLWIAVAIVAAFLYAPLAKSFLGESSRILFFHVPMAWASFVAFVAAGIWSARYLWRRRPDDDRAAAAAVELGLVFCALATITGAMWARVMWGAWWNWDPRQSSIAVVLIFYAAYLVLRGSLEDPDSRARLTAVYAVLGLVVAPFFFFVMPRMATYTLHPDAVINVRRKVDVDPRMLQVLIMSSLGFNVLFFWIHRLRLRVLRLAARRPPGGLAA